MPNNKPPLRSQTRSPKWLVESCDGRIILTLASGASKMEVGMRPSVAQALGDRLQERAEEAQDE